MGLSSGQLLAQRYRLSRCIAVGGMGEVWQAADTRLDRQIAIKVLKPELSGDPEFRHRMRQPRLSTERTLDILEQAGDALQAAHERGVVHRDIKPANILITPDGRVKITDFGIARAVDAAPLTHHGMVLGTAHYIAPEQAAGHETGPAGDVYSLGVVGYECLAGQRPFVADNAVTVAMMHIRDRPPPLPRDVPPAARALIDAALAKDPRQRYRTGGEFAAAVAAVHAGHRLPLPAGVTGVKETATTVLPATAPLTAMLPPAAMSPPTAMLAPSPPHRYPARRSAARIVIVLLGVLVLVLGSYLARTALRSTASPGTASPGTAPPSQLEPAPTQPAPTQPAPEPNNPDEGSPEVLIIPTDYWGHRGSDAILTAKVHGLIPRVVDDDGELVDPDLRSQCRVIGLDPLSGFVPRGSTLELTCRRGN